MPNWKRTVATGAGFGVVFWLIGRACMFVLAGRCGRVVDDLRKALGHALRRKPLNVVECQQGA
jgi:hypothetical protein